MMMMLLLSLVDMSVTITLLTIIINEILCVFMDHLLYGALL